jgi:hypothetical protein
MGSGWLSRYPQLVLLSFYFIQQEKIYVDQMYCNCAGSSGAVHSDFLIDVYLNLENPGGSGFWVGENRRVTEGNKEGQFTSNREQRWTDPDTEGGFQVNRQGEQGELGEQGADPVHKSEPYLVYVCNE